MQRWCIAFSLAALLILLSDGPASAQSQPPSNKLVVTASSAYTWSDGKSDIVQLQGPVTIKLDSAELSAQRAVIWLTNQPGAVIQQQRAEIALLGDAEIRQPADGITRSGPRLFVTAAVRGDIRISADERLARDESDTPTFREALDLRGGAPVGGASPSPTGRPLTAPPQGEAPAAPLEPTPQAGNGGEGGEAGAESGEDSGTGTGGRKLKHAAAPTTRPRRGPVRFHADHVETVPTPDDTLAFQLTGAVTLLQTRENGDFVELQSERCILFTSEKARGLGGIGAAASVGQKVTGAYLEGDVRIDYTPELKARPEQRLTAERVYYDFTTNEAVLTDAILRTSEPQTKVPITIRAEKLRQLSAGEYRGEHVELSTSSFALPTYSVKTDKIYIRQDQVPLPDSDAGEEQTQTTFVADDDTLRAFGVPVFYLPEISGTVDKDPYPLRSLSISNSNRFGFGLASTFGLFELLGKPRPKGLDLSVLADYYSKRGPATGLDGKYYGSNIDTDTKALSDFEGELRSFIITDHGADQFGGARSDVKPPDQVRGKFLFEHQQFFPDHWQAQLRLGYASDPTLLEEYFPNEFYTDHPYDAQAYFKRQVDTEAITLGVNVDTNRFPTTADQQQEQFDVERLPEIGYRRIGDSLADDKLTFFSENTFDRLRFARSHYSLAQQGFVYVGPGLPSQGYTGTSTSPNYRGDSRQEVDYPVQLGQVKMVPYVVGRATGYTDSPSRDGQGRIFGAAGVRFTTAFSRVEDGVESDLLDLHRLRHVIEPEVNLFTSGQTIDRTKLYVYDENVDGISDVSAAQFALHNRFQTYRGGPGKERSVDFLSVNVSANVFTNPPRDAGILPTKFRGLFFTSEPEASVPRDSINGDLTWLVSDNTAFLSDAEYNVDHQELATGAFGVAVKRDTRLSYFLGLRYIEQLNSDIATFAAEYELTAKYTLQFSQSYDFGVSKNVTSTFGIRRRFDTLTAALTIFHDASTGESGFRFNVEPEGFGNRVSGQGLGNLFTPQ